MWNEKIPFGKKYFYTLLSTIKLVGYLPVKLMFATFYNTKFSIFFNRNS